MAKYYFTSKAVEDLANIWEYTFKNWSERQADAYYKTLIASCKEITNNPNLGKNYEGIAPNLLGIKVQRHLIFYRVREKGSVEVIRILHERMDLKRRIAE